MLKISVILATYNGAKYILEQLNSIRLQTQKVDEVIIQDDCSTDNTVQIIQNFIKLYNLIDWSISVNLKKLGWKRNFFNMMQKTSGEIIFYSDQDDVWIKDKVEIMAKNMRKNPLILCLAGKYSAIDSMGNILDISLNKRYRSLNTGQISMIEMNNAYLESHRQGCVLAFRKKIIEIYEKIGLIDNATDKQICRIAMIYDGMYQIDKIMIKHRFHYENASTSIKTVGIGYGLKETRIAELKDDIFWLKRAIKFFETSNLTYKNKKIKLIEDIIILGEKRIEFFDGEHWYSLCILIKNFTLYSSYRIFFGDFCYKYYINKIVGKLYSLLYSRS